MQIDGLKSISRTIVMRFSLSDRDNKSLRVVVRITEVSDYHVLFPS